MEMASQSGSTIHPLSRAAAAAAVDSAHTGPPAVDAVDALIPVTSASTPSYAAGHFLAAKAGMRGVDKAHVAKVVEEASRGSKYYENAQAREQVLTQRIEAIKRKVRATSPAELAGFLTQMDGWAAAAEAERRFTRVCCVVDMDAFYASVEERDDPSLRGVPFAVGGIGMISTASYEARKYGVRSAMPGFIGLKLCPQLRFVPTHFDKYAAASEEARRVFREYDASLRAGSLDEAYLDLTAFCIRRGLVGDASAVHTEPCEDIHVPHTLSRVPTNVEQARIAASVAEMRCRVTDTTRGLTCSAGTGPNFMLAKIASNDRKPNGQTIVPFDRERILQFLHQRGVREIPGVGRVTERVLVELGIRTIGDIVTQRATVRAAFNERMSLWLLRCALGVSEEEVHGFGDSGAASDDDEDGVGRKSISHERTFRDCNDRTTLLQKCEELARMVSDELKEEGILGRNVSIRLKLHTFEVRQRSHMLPRASNDAAAIADAAKALLVAEMPICLRLLGVRVSSLLLEERRRKGALDEFLQKGAVSTTAPRRQDAGEVDESSRDTTQRKRPRVTDWWSRWVQPAAPVADDDDVAEVIDLLDDSGGES